MSGGLLSPSLASDHGHTSLLSRQKLAAFIYAILPTAFRDAPKKTRPLARTAYLDGVRGLAALGVVVLHMVLGFFPNSSYAYNGTPGRDSIFQMPFVRLLYTGQPTIFFLISGYVLSISTIKKCRNQAWGPLQLDLSSKIFRRMFRLYIPSIIATFIPMFMVSFGLFPDVAKFNDEMPHHTFNMAAREPTFFRQFWLWCKTIPPLFWPFDWENFSQNSPYAYQLWTIPVEYRCSMILFLLHIGLSRCRSKTRLVINGIFSLYFLALDKWDVFLFVAGAFIAEVDIIREEASEAQLPKSETGETKLPSAPRKYPNQWLLVGGVILGLWILSVPAADIWNAWTFAILETWAPKNYKGIFRFWDAVGTVILVWSMTGLPSFQRFFTRRIFLYLGNISFSLYLTHTIALKFLLYPIMPWLYLIFGYSTPFQYGLSFAIGGFLTVMLSFWIADVFQRHIEEPSARFTKWINTKCSAS
ncbi:Acyltransferase family protein [Coccidioides posadasii C735 delta SOWgp]|uniref:Acyltransferase family protein n=1 Tax=Coccidioides posadasii (strain C735) TaxID=222929 RepID=C5P395_COCP7|nr:Acyltransferase family protein [Coccidioides posadasii C735 delta SOWgp]EER28783.1 Acyltransferase family protein [Coccidioides posadasii C735 delta SOWgp]|eukprot:XP_003070928.1 Acyltransferase family protein [Coccidioides posadasii C735 delta SOWgp]